VVTNLKVEHAGADLVDDAGSLVPPQNGNDTGAMSPE
jgi:hypothetical protein